ncbi:hypothetical protein ACVXG7_12655 [Enterobacter hormaechei]
MTVGRIGQVRGSAWQAEEIARARPLSKKVCSSIRYPPRQERNDLLIQTR